jgi:hypothetical protein
MKFEKSPPVETAHYSAKDKEGDPRFKGFLDAPGKTKTITR